MLFPFQSYDWGVGAMYEYEKWMQRDGRRIHIVINWSSLNSQPSYSPTHASTRKQLAERNGGMQSNGEKGTAFSITICQYLVAHSWIALDTSASMRWGQSHFRVHFLHRYSIETHYSSKGIESTSNLTSHSHRTAIPHNNAILHFQSQTHPQICS